MKSTSLILLLLSIIFISFDFTGPDGHEKSETLAVCSAKLEDDILILENNLICRRYQWNQGNLISLSLEDKQKHFTWDLENTLPDISFPGVDQDAANGHLDVTESAATEMEPAYLKVNVTMTLGELEIKRSFRIYPDCPAIACDYYLRGKVTPVERNSISAEKQFAVIERVCLPGKHWRLTPVEFFDRTDVTNTLVQTSPILAYNQPAHLTGNILFADDMLQDRGIFILKEAPCGYAHLAYPGYDFTCRIGEIRTVGLGLDPKYLDEKNWVRYYGYVTGVTSGGELGRLSALRTYQEKIRIHKPGRDELIMMNTWGDRAQDAKVSEAFALDELDAGAKLGITHFCLDDGWQTGRSGASVYGGSLDNIWDNSDYWKLKPDKFPHGLAPVVKRGKELGIEVCLWFNPSRDESYAHWESDADIMIDFYRNDGIRTFKIDGVDLPDKQAEINLRKMFHKVINATHQNAVFELDVTGVWKRFGYHYFNEYGNIFLENRYTDFGRYYPHWTLRNLWMLSRYLPPQNMQIEFLNKWRNEDKYLPDDPFAPYNIPFDYIFAITMMAQPLAWFEGTGLPEEAFEIAPLVKTYKEYWGDIHAGQIFPIGDEPSGRSWTGFQSIQGEEGYFLIFREYNNETQAALSTWIAAGQTVNCQAILGQGEDFIAKADEEGRIVFTLPGQNNFALYRYTKMREAITKYGKASAKTEHAPR